jgi:hypothetical protein
MAATMWLADKIGDDDQFMGLLLVILGLVSVLWIAVVLARGIKARFGKKGRAGTNPPT